jgi:hypothetical protein
MRNDRLIAIVMGAIIAGSVLSFYVRPKPPSDEFVTPQQELPGFQARYPGDTSLANRVANSYQLAFILVQSPYICKNVTALAALREWARDQFQSHPDFLHPVSLRPADRNHDTVFGALGYNLFAAGRYWLEEAVGQLLKVQIAHFHETSAFQSFNTAYFDFCGKDSDAATLLARYESERAKSAVDVILWTLVWFAGLVAAAFTLIKESNKDFFGQLQRVTAGAWGLLAISYFSQAWLTGSATPLISAIVSAGLAAYLTRPMLLVSHRDERQRLMRVHLAPCWIAIAAWFTYTCLAVQLLTWMRTGLLMSPDPVSLLLCSITGNFVHEPVHGKRIISTAIAGIWLALTAWALCQRKKDQPFYQEPDSHFETLNAAVSYDRVS